MMRFINSWAIYVFCVCFTLAAKAQVPLQTPIAGIQGKDYFIAWRMDNDTTTGIIRDAYCGDFSYDNYNGVDFALRCFPQMDSGVYVLAAADGIVIYAVDSSFDRVKHYTGGNDFYGNIIALYHSDSTLTYYGSLKKNSARVDVGDTVKAGDTIAMVGSSGVWSSFPHLHFEVWKNNLPIDPFSGNCGNSKSRWVNSPAYDTAYRILADGFLGFAATQDTFQERPPAKYEFDRDDDSTLTFWLQHINVKKSDTVKIQWWELQNGDLWYEWKYGYEMTMPYSYLPFYVSNPAFFDAPGLYRLSYFFNDKLLMEQYFDVYLRGGGGTGTIRKIPQGNLLVFTDAQSKKLHIIGEVPLEPGQVQVYDLSGRQVMSFQAERSKAQAFEYGEQLQPGIYFVFLIRSDGIKRYKLLF